MDTPRERINDEIAELFPEESEQGKMADLWDDDHKKLLAVIAHHVGRLSPSNDSLNDDVNGRYAVPFRADTITDTETVDLDTAYSTWDIILENKTAVNVRWSDSSGAATDRYIGNSSAPTKVGGIPVETSYVEIEPANDAANNPKITMRAFP
jgi:hypothetical protein